MPGEIILLIAVCVVVVFGIGLWMGRSSKEEWAKDYVNDGLKEMDARICGVVSDQIKTLVDAANGHPVHCPNLNCRENNIHFTLGEYAKCNDLKRARR